MPVFEPVTSIPFILVNFVFGFLLLMPLVLLVVAIFAFVYENNLTAALLIFVLLLVAVILILLHANFAIKEVFTTINIDEKGIHYLNKFNGKIVREVSWESLVKRKRSVAHSGIILYDITTEQPLKSIYAYIVFYYLVDKETVTQKKEIFHGNHIFYALYFNRLKLIRTFILGITHFRPDLRIDPKIFSDHFIDAETFEIDYKQQNFLIFFVVLLVLAVMIGIYFLCM